MSLPWHTSADSYKSNVIMACNWLVGRGKYEEIGEVLDLYIPPSTSLAGKIYGSNMAQVMAGVKHGALNEVGAVTFNLTRNALGDLDKLGLEAMQPFSNLKDYYNSDLKLISELNSITTNTEI